MALSLPTTGRPSREGGGVAASATDLTALSGGPLIDAIRRTDDATLRAVARDPAVRDPLLDAVLEGLPEYAVAARVRALRGTVRIEVPGTSRQVRLARGRVVPEASDAPADVVLGCSTRLLLRILAGQANAGLEHVAGRLRITGDTELALGLGASLRDPDGHRIDPRRLDPFEVAEVVGTADADHLRALMRSGFRAVVLEELFARMPEFLDQRKAHGVHLDVGLRLLGRPDGGVDSYLISIHDGEARVTAHAVDHVPAGHRDAVLTCQAEEFLKLATGHLTAVTGVLRGRLKVSGDKAAALRLSAVLALPKPAARR